ncbi:RING finger and SPRY domain-containing protein 1 [Mortierella polycephala]|uniref:RING finger and SPRY domain-containing protein 1 n=1 Tax=Mortierella polycephala TaxID=41804 RepID=A0A9P6PLW0_9FUNG|nr:RING finger and SPRY domain-containing protein 1 [Mortierella polycephala]
MNRMASRFLERVFVKVHIRAAWNKLHNMTEQGELSSALESLIHLTTTDSSYCELIGVMVDLISTESLGIAAPFLCHIIDMAALPSHQTTRRMSQQLLSKCDPGGLARLRSSKRKSRSAAALIWSMLANRLAGEMSAALFSDAVCECLLSNIENDADMLCKVFSIIALEKFSLTGPCKTRIMQTPIRRLLRATANMSTFGLTDQEELAGVLQAKFCAEWSLRNIFRDAAEDTTDTADTHPSRDQSPSITQTENDMCARESLTSANGAKKATGSKTSNINVMLNTLDATRHWKISEDGLTIRNDGSMFESIRATQSVTCGKWFYEVTLVTAGIMQLGWATTHCQFSPEEGTGIGDDIFGFAYDGCRRSIWADGESESYGDLEAWRPGDILGFYLDVDNAIMECFINGKSLGSISPIQKDHFSIQAISGYYPAFSFTSFQQATVNFGATPFKYPPALPWRNLNDIGAIDVETRSAITRPRSDSIYGRIQLDPLTGVRLPSMPEEDGEIDYSLLCTICCDHTATVTLQPCGHDGLCVECAYSLDMCPLCRSRIFQRQMISNTTNESKDVLAASGLCISGLSSDASSGIVSIPGLSTSSTVTSTWSAEYCGPSGSSLSSRDSTLTNLYRHHDTVAVAVAAIGGHSPSTESLSRRRNTLAATSRISLDSNLEDPFSPPSTAYFTFLNRPARAQHSHLNPMEVDSVDPLEQPSRRESSAGLPHPHHPPADSPSSAVVTGDAAFAVPGQHGSSSWDALERFEQAVVDLDAEDPDEADVVLIEEGREASDTEVMEQSTLDFPEGHSIHSRRSSVQVSGSIGTGVGMPLPLPISVGRNSNSSLSSPSVPVPVTGGAPPGMLDFANMGVSPLGACPGVATGTSTRFGGRRASMPCNRLEM